MKLIPITNIGSYYLMEELVFLKTIRRSEVIVEISDARSYGDLKENSEYISAREEQGFIEDRIQKIENILMNSQIVDIFSYINDGKIIFGSTVILFNFNIKRNVIYKIVGFDEVDLKYNKISLKSPIAKFLIGRFEGEIVNSNTPSGFVRYFVLKVSYL